MALRRTRVLLGHMPLADADKFLRGRSPDVPSDPAAFKKLWSAAYDAVARGPWPDLDAQPRPLAASRHTKRLTKLPAFSAAVAGTRWSLASVHIDALLSVQRRVDEGYAREATQGSDPTDPASLLPVALPLERAARPLDVKVEERAITVSTDSPDLRVLAPFRAHDPATDRTTVGFTVGWGAPFVTVLRVRDRHILQNGYHRVFGMRARGAPRVPAIVLDARGAEQAGAGRPGFASLEALASARPPTLASFFDDAVAVSVRVPTVTRTVRLSVEEGVAKR